MPDAGGMQLPGTSPNQSAFCLDATTRLHACFATPLAQADQQQALLPHFSKEERCMKVAFERVSLHFHVLKHRSACCRIGAVWLSVQR